MRIKSLILTYRMKTGINGQYSLTNGKKVQFKLFGGF